MRNRQPTLRQLEYFIAVSEEKHYRRAAEHLQVSQPTITAQITTLEETLGVRLLERSRAGVHLTPVGRELLPQARDILTRVSALQNAAKPSASGPTGTYRLGIAPTLGPYLLPEIIPELHRLYPQLQLYFQERVPIDLEQDLHAGRHDLIISPLPLISKELTTEVLFHEPLKVVLAHDHPLAKHSTLTAKQLRGEKILILQERHHLHRQVHALASELGAELLSNYEGTSLDTLRQMAGMGMGIAMLPTLYIRSEIDQRGTSEVVVSPLHNKHITRTIAISWRRSSPNQTFFRQLAKLFRRLSGSLFGDAISLGD